MISSKLQGKGIRTGVYLNRPVKWFGLAHLDASHEGVIRRLEERAAELVQRFAGEYCFVAVAAKAERKRYIWL